MITCSHDPQWLLAWRRHIEEGTRGAAQSSSVVAPRRGAWASPLLLVAASYATALPSVTSDSRLSTLVSLSILHQHNVDLDEYATAVDQTQSYLSTRSGEHIASVYPYGGSLLAVPLIALADLDAGLRGPNLDEQARTGKISGGVEFWAAAIIAFVSVLMMAFTLRRMRVPHVVGVLLIAGWALAGPLASTCARGLWQHGPAGLALVAATLGVVEVERRSSLADDRPLWAPLLLTGFACAYGPYIRATTGVADRLLLMAGTWLVGRAGRARSIVWLVVGALAGATPYLLTRSVVVDDGYQSPTGLSALSFGNMPRGLLGSLVSPSRGVLIWCPFLLVAAIVVARRRVGRLGVLAPCFGLGALSVLGFTAARRVCGGRLFRRSTADVRVHHVDRVVRRCDGPRRRRSPNISRCAWRRDRPRDGRALDRRTSNGDGSVEHLAQRRRASVSAPVVVGLATVGLVPLPREAANTP